mmetsp:Transcript_6914/g.21840  ORF Transcript_6914/g.21840 Transcript_6914/m.21840 type:complete len:239 (-) Transcript_6914:369-1085(-)
MAARPVHGEQDQRTDRREALEKEVALVIRDGEQRRRRAVRTAEDGHVDRQPRRDGLHVVKRYVRATHRPKVPERVEDKIGDAHDDRQPERHPPRARAHHDRSAHVDQEHHEDELDQRGMKAMLAREYGRHLGAKVEDEVGAEQDAAELAQPIGRRRAGQLQRARRQQLAPHRTHLLEVREQDAQPANHAQRLGDELAVAHLCVQERVHAAPADERDAPRQLAPLEQHRARAERLHDGA